MIEFKLGNLVVTRRIAEDMKTDEEFLNEVSECIIRHKKNDWGELSENDAHLNDEAVKNNDDQILSKYSTCKGDIYIITEWDRSATTVLYPDEY